MNKKIIIAIVIFFVICIGVGVAALVINNMDTENIENLEQPNNQEQANNQEPNEGGETMGNKILVVYYSAQNHTKTVAEKIANNLSADLFEIEPTQAYTNNDLDWTDNDSRVSREHDDESLRDIELVSTTVENWEDYDTVLIGYPIWWGIAAWPVDTFVEANDFTGKTVIPFCTSSSSGLGQSGNLLANKANGGNWLDGIRFNSNPTDTTIKNWTDSLK